MNMCLGVFTRFALLVSILGVLAAGVLAQDPCEDAEGKAERDKTFRELYPKKDPESRKKTVEIAKEYIDKYGKCEGDQLAEYFVKALPGLEKAYDKSIKDELVRKFDAGYKARDWDQVFETGKQLLDKYPDEFRAAELVLGTVGLSETAKNPRVTKWNEESLRFARQAIQDLEAGKEFKTFGVEPFIYKHRDDAIGFMNLTIGYIYAYDKNNKKEAMPYFYKASQLATSNESAALYASIGGYFYDETAKLNKEITEWPEPAATDTEEVRKQKYDAFMARKALMLGTAERALDAYARAYERAKESTPEETKFKASMLARVTELYEVRFNNKDGMMEWVKAAVAKPLPDPSTPITPVVETPAAAADPD